MTTAYRADLVRTVYESEIAKLAAGPSIRTEAIVVSCPTTTCGVQYSLLGPRDITEEESQSTQLQSRRRCGTSIVRTILPRLSWTDLLCL